jgi:hypothetical protein
MSFSTVYIYRYQMTGLSFSLLDYPAYSNARRLLLTSGQLNSRLEYHKQGKLSYLP